MPFKIGKTLIERAALGDRAAFLCAGDIRGVRRWLTIFFEPLGTVFIALVNDDFADTGVNGQDAGDTR